MITRLREIRTHRCASVLYQHNFHNNRRHPLQVFPANLLPKPASPSPHSVLRVPFCFLLSLQRTDAPCPPNCAGKGSVPARCTLFVSFLQRHTPSFRRDGGLLWRGRAYFSRRPHGPVDSPRVTLTTGPPPAKNAPLPPPSPGVFAASCVLSALGVGDAFFSRAQLAR